LSHQSNYSRALTGAGVCRCDKTPRRIARRAADREGRLAAVVDQNRPDDHSLLAQIILRSATPLPAPEVARRVHGADGC
jgi:hypothetical protein